MVTEDSSLGYPTWIFLLLQFSTHSTATEAVLQEHNFPEHNLLNNRVSLNRRSLTQPPVNSEPEPESQTRIEMTYGITVNRKALITCEITLGTADSTATVSEQSTSAVYLICPQVPTSVCYMDCTPSCVLGPNGCRVPDAIAQVVEECTYESNDPTRVSLSYVLNLEALNQSGQWNCDFRGQRAPRPIDLRAVERDPNTRSLSSTPPTRSEQTVERRSLKNKNIGMWDLRTSALPVTQPALSVILFVALAISLVLNVILCVRCALTRNYFDNVSRGKIDPCLNRILCFHRDNGANNTSELPKLSLYPATYTPLLTDMNPNFMQYSTTVDGTSTDRLLLYTGQHPRYITKDDPAAALSKLRRSSFRFPGSGVPTPGSQRVEPSSFHNQISGSVSTTDQHSDPHLPEGACLIPMDTSFTIAEGHGYGITTCGTNESLTGSMVLTNDSNSITDGAASANGNTFLPHTQRSDYPLPRPHSDQFQPHVTIVGRSSYAKCDPTHVTGGLKINSTPSSSIHITQQRPFLPSSPESYDCVGTVRQLTHIRSMLTPLLVRFPSGEAGLLFSAAPENGETNTSGTGSLNRNALCYSRSNRHQHRKLISERDTQKRTIPTLDTDSESGITHVNPLDSDKCNATINLVKLNSRKHTSALRPTLQLTSRVTHEHVTTSELVTSSIATSEKSSESESHTHERSNVAGVRTTSNASPDYVFLPAHKTEQLATVH